MRGSAQPRGFSLMELTVVIALMVMIMGFSTPTLLRTLRKYQRENIAQQLAQMAIRARTMAMQRNQQVSTRVGWVWTGSSWAIRYGIDLNNNGTIEPDLNEPYVEGKWPPVYIATWSFSWNWQTACGVPAGYIPASGWSYHNGLSFSPQGTLVVEGWFFDGTSWVYGTREATEPYFLNLYIWDTADPPDYYSWYVTAVTPAGRVRTFRYTKTGGNGCGIWGGAGPYRWVS